jgi:ribA/ribD-fused uncharacterized protein
MNDTTHKMRATETHVYFVSGPFSQWHPSPFTASLPVLTATEPRAELASSGRVLQFSHAEQAMMASKASVFGDEEILEKILQASSPKAQKELGRQVRNFVPAIWNSVAYRIVCIMNFCKFSAEDEIKRLLLETGSKHLVEGAWYDPIWGVGLAWDDPQIEDPSNWKGTNWLGEALMAVRSILAEEGADRDPWKIPLFQSIPASSSR